MTNFIHSMFLRFIHIVASVSTPFVCVTEQSLYGCTYYILFIHFFLDKHLNDCLFFGLYE